MHIWGISANPANPIGAYLASTHALDPGETGSFVFQVDLGMTTLQGASPARTHKSIAIVFGNRWLPQNDVCVVPEAQTIF
jgi:hypothetical protein